MEHEGPERRCYILTGTCSLKMSLLCLMCGTTVGPVMAMRGWIKRHYRLPITGIFSNWLTLYTGFSLQFEHLFQDLGP